MDGKRFSASVVIDRSADDLYAMVSDVTRMGEWSPECTACWWDEGAGPRVGAFFSGRNEDANRAWETRCQVVTADPGREFAFMVSGNWIKWSYAFAPADGGTRLTETWDFLPEGIAGFHEHFGDKAESMIARRTEAAHLGIPQTLDAIKRAAEGS